MFNGCRSQCDTDRTETVSDCRETKRTEITACKVAKQVAIDACKELSGKAKRDCKKIARQDKRQCKKDARSDKRDCISEADTTRSTCRTDCAVVRDSACTSENQEARKCRIKTDPVFVEAQQCKQQCGNIKELGLAGYNSSCPKGHGGNQGAKITFINNSRQTLFYNNSPLSDGESMTVTQECGTTIEHDFFIPNQSLYEHRAIVGPIQCCEDLQEEIRFINE